MHDRIGSYYVGIDLGTTFSAAAVCRPDRPGAEVVSLGERSSAVPSAVFADEHGEFLFGVAAERRTLSDPARVVRGFKRRVGDGVPVLVGQVPVAAEELAARFVARMVSDVAAREGGRPAGMAVTHPASWGPYRLDALRAALAAQGLGAATLLPEPQAAAIGYAAAERVEPGAVVAVYDLGGGTFDAAVARKLPDGGFELLGEPEGIDGLGGLDFDEAVIEHVRTALGPAWEGLDPTDPTVLTAVARLRRDCAEAKEALSADTEVVIPVVLPGLSTRVRLVRSEFEEMIRPAVTETVAALARAVDSAGFTPAEVDAVLLVGGSSRIPLVAQLVSAAFGRPASVDVDPKGVIASGAALAARANAPRSATRPGSTGPGAPMPAAISGDRGAKQAEPIRRAEPARPAPSPPPPPPQPRSLTRPDVGIPRKRKRVLSLAGAALVAAAVAGGVLAGIRGPEAVGPSTSPAVAETPSSPTQVASEVAGENREPAPAAREGRRAAPPPANKPAAPSEANPPASTTAPPDPPTPPDNPADNPTTPPEEPTTPPANPASPPDDGSGSGGDDSVPAGGTIAPPEVLPVTSAVSSGEGQG